MTTEHDNDHIEIFEPYDPEAVKISKEQELKKKLTSIEEQIEIAQKALAKAKELADATGTSFVFTPTVNPEGGFTYYGSKDGEGYTSWQNSSLNC